MRHLLTALGLFAFFGLAVVACREDDRTTRQESRHDTRMPTALQIINRMAKAYSECATYTDTGTVTTVFKHQPKSHTVVKKFSTAMVRPNQFRFEYKEEGKPNSRYVVWRSSRDVRTWWDVTQESESGDFLGLALAGATGVSGGSAHTVPALLMPDEVGGRLLTDLEQATRADDDSLGSHRCFRIEALYAGDPITIWIDQQSFLVRRIDETSEFDDFSTVESTIYNPVIDEDVAPKLLEYNAP